MEKNTVRSGTRHKRLLIILFCVSPCFLYGRQSDSIELKINGKEFFLDRELEIDVLIRNDSPYLRRNKDIPRFILEREPYVAVLSYSSATPELGSLRLRYVYRFEKTGSFTFSPLLQWKRHSLVLDPFNLTVHAPPLSERTVFLWKLCTEEGVPIDEEEPLEQGRAYRLFLTASFYSPLSATPSKTKTASAGFATLPPELTHIECPVPENAVLEKHEWTIHASEITEPVSLTEDEYILAAYHWIPLQTGLQNLPTAQLFFAAGGRTESTAAAYTVTAQDRAAVTDPGNRLPAESDSFATAFQTGENGAPALLGGEKKSYALKIAECRRQEAILFFPHRIRRERERLETALNIVHSLPVYPRSFRLAAVGLTVLLIIGAAACFIGKKKRLLLPCIVAALICGTETGLLFCRSMQSYGVCTAADATAVVRRIPETTGSGIHRLAIGETVLLVRKTIQWYYITTADGISGWVLRKSIVPTEYTSTDIIDESLLP